MITTTADELWDRRGELMVAAIAEHARTGATGIAIAETAPPVPAQTTVPISELWDRRGEVYAAALSNPRRPAFGLPLAEALPAEQRAALARELRESTTPPARKVRVAADPVKLRQAIIESARAAARTAVEPMVRDRRTIAESAPNCVCLKVGFGGFCTTCR